jgi:hypothetical protein
MVETNFRLLGAPAYSFKLTVPWDVGFHDTVELVPATNVPGNINPSRTGVVANCAMSGILRNKTDARS